MSLRAAINEKCRDCIYDEAAAGSAATQIELCTGWDCPLWKVRPIRVQRVPYSRPVCEEQLLSAEMAAYRLEYPRLIPPAHLEAQSRGERQYGHVQSTDAMSEEEE